VPEPSAESLYRLRLAEGFLDEARQDLALARWRSCVDNSQLAVENAAKAILALVGPVGRTHRPGPLLRGALSRGGFGADQQTLALRVAELAELLGPDTHIESDYGDEANWRTPWELFDADDARAAHAMAEEAVRAAAALLP
jgi:HEPN domain-containing protein